MKFLALVVLVALVPVLLDRQPRPRQSANPNAGQGRAIQSHSQNQPPPPAVSSPVGQSPVPQTKDALRAEIQSEPKATNNGQQTVTIPKPVTVTVEPGPLDYLSVLAAFGLVVVGVVGTCAALRSLKILQLQTRAAMKAATAANTSAHAVIDGDRAWMIAQMGGMPPFDPKKTDVIYRLVCRVQNIGKTPGFLTQSAQGHRLTADKETLPDTPAFDNPFLYAGRGQIVPTNTNATLVFYLTPEQTKAVHAGKLMLWVYGLVEYADIYRRSHYTYYCFRYSMESIDPATYGFVPDGPPKYNEYT